MLKYFFDNQEISEFLPSSFLSAIKPINAAISAFALLTFFFLLFILIRYIKKRKVEPSYNVKFSLAIVLLSLPFLSFMGITVDYRFYPVEKSKLLTSNYFQSLDNYSKEYFKNRLVWFGYEAETGEFDKNRSPTLSARIVDDIITDVKKKQAKLSINENNVPKM